MDTLYNFPFASVLIYTDSYNKSQLFTVIPGSRLKVVWTQTSGRGADPSSYWNYNGLEICETKIEDMSPSHYYGWTL